MKVFSHLIYEYQKGLRELILHTMHIKCREEIETKLKQKNIPYIIQQVNSIKINVFFGNESCIQVIKSFGNKPLNQYTDEEDFILGMMLGYAIKKQCQRYNKKKLKKKSVSG